MRLPHILLVALMLMLPGCARLLNATVSTSDLIVLHDQPYGSLPRQTADVYRPAHPDGMRPVVVFLYGGSWKTGDKAMYVFAAAALAHHGMMVVVPDYRLYPQVRYPDFLRDNAQAVVWAARHATEWNGDPGRLVLMGHSAGAYDAAMLATDPEWLAEAGGSRDQLAGFVGLAGPYDFLPITDPDIIPIFPHDDPATMPVNHVTAGVPPMLLMAGTSDQTVRPRNTISLAEHVRDAGGDVQVKLYPDTGHIGLVLDLTAPFSRRAPVLADTVTWIGTLIAR